MKQQSFIVAVLSALFASCWSAGPAISQTTHDPHADPKLDSSIHCDIPRGEGVIMALDIEQSKVDISHRPAHSVGFDEMVMTFDVIASVDLNTFAVGERVHFLLKLQRGESDKIAWMCSLEKDESVHKACMAKLHVKAMKLAAADIEQCSMDDMESTDAKIHDDSNDERSVGYRMHADHP